MKKVNNTERVKITVNSWFSSPAVWVLNFIFTSKVPVFYCLMKNSNHKIFTKKFSRDFLQISMNLVKINDKKFFGKNLVIWIFSLNSKNQGL